MTASLGKRIGHAIGAFALLLAAACSGGSQKSGGDADWALYGLDSDEQRFSTLEQIGPDNIDRLGLAWSLELPAAARSLQATPLAIDGVLYFTTSMANVYAVDAKTGEILWEYDPEAGLEHPRALRTTQSPNRGVAYYDGSVIVGALDGRLISLDAKSGKPNWIVDTFEEGDRDERKTSTGAPRVFDGKVIIGNAGADFGTRGYVTTYDAKTGEFLWRFYTVPGNPADGFEDETQEMAAKTWNGEWWRWGGGGTVWNAITYDREMNRLYIGVGNSSNYDPEQRSPGGGDNLFLASIVALDADTGKYIWHYQVNPREAWDFKATADIVLADLEIDGKRRRVLMQAPTNGFFYVIDRDTGKLLSAEKIGKVTWAERIDLETGRPVEVPGSRYRDGPVTFWPSQLGVHNWQAMAFNPELGLVYIPTLKLASTYSTSARKAREAEQFALGAEHYEFALGSDFRLARVDEDDGTGGLLAWDPVAQKARWKVKLDTGWNGGTMATATNLVFQGTADGWLHAYDARTGKRLWKHEVGHGVVGPPITYLVDGEQYVTLLAGYGAAAPDDPGWRFGKHLPKVVTFKLGGTAKLPAMAPRDRSVKPIYDPAFAIDEAAAARGRELWNRNCAVCHTPNGGNANWPDLRESEMAHDLATLRQILKTGALASLGMPKFDDLSDRQIADIHMAVKYYSRQAAKGDTAMPEGGRPF